MSAIVSVVIPTYYRNEYLQGCIESVIQQEHEDLEIIVVDDSGCANAKNVTDKFGCVTLIELDKNVGPNQARNIGIKHADGKYLQLLDDDDRLYPKKIKKQVSIFENNDDIGVVYCGFEAESGTRELPKKVEEYDTLEQALKFELNACITSTMLIRLSVLQHFLPLPDVPGSDDTYWKIELSQRTEFSSIPEALVKKGEPQTQRMFSEGAIEGTWDILNRYDELYKNYDSSVKNYAKAKAALREASYIFDHKYWSYRGIKLYILCIYYHPSPPLWLYIRTILSFGGKLGHGLPKIVRSTTLHG